MHFYGIGYRDVLSLPIQFFWLMYANIDRIQASNDVRNLDIQYIATATGMAGGDGVKDFRKSLVLQVGEPIKIKVDPMSAKLDRSGVNSLKNLLRSQDKKKK